MSWLVVKYSPFLRPGEQNRLEHREMQNLKGASFLKTLFLIAINPLTKQIVREAKNYVQRNPTPPHRHHPNLINGSKISRPTRPSIATRHRTHLYRSQCLGGKERRPTPERKDPDIFYKGTITTHAQTQPKQALPTPPLPSP